MLILVVLGIVVVATFRHALKNKKTETVQLDETESFYHSNNTK